jgi:hypothetical protein
MHLGQGAVVGVATPRSRGGGCGGQRSGAGRVCVRERLHSVGPAGVFTRQKEGDQHTANNPQCSAASRHEPNVLRFMANRPCRCQRGGVTSASATLGREAAAGFSRRGDAVLGQVWRSVGEIASALNLSRKSRRFLPRSRHRHRNRDRSRDRDRSRSCGRGRGFGRGGTRRRRVAIEGALWCYPMTSAHDRDTESRLTEGSSR